MTVALVSRRKSVKTSSNYGTIYLLPYVALKSGDEEKLATVASVYQVYYLLV